MICLLADGEHIVFKDLLMRIIADKIHRPDRDIMPIIGNGFTIRQVEHPFQIGELVAPPASIQAVAPSVVLHQTGVLSVRHRSRRVGTYVIPFSGYITGMTQNF